LALPGSFTDRPHILSSLFPDVVSRTQLVVLELRDDWISFDEALDPRGFDPSLG
jgi:hypothetical protein